MRGAKYPAFRLSGTTNGSGEAHPLDHRAKKSVRRARLPPRCSKTHRWSARSQQELRTPDGLVDVPPPRRMIRSLSRSLRALRRAAGNPWALPVTATLGPAFALWGDGEFWSSRVSGSSILDCRTVLSSGLSPRILSARRPVRPFLGHLANPHPLQTLSEWEMLKERNILF